MEQAARVAGVADVSDITDEPSRDVEWNPLYRRSSQNASRASLPLSHRRSQSSVIQTRNDSVQSGPLAGLEGIIGQHSSGAAQAQAQAQAHADAERRISHPPQPLGEGMNEPDAEADDIDDPNDIAWGPSHPCFPHLNPHVPFSSPLYQSTRIIRIRRDWMVAGDLAPAFSTLYPEILEPYMSEETFRTLLGHVNTELMRMFDPWAWRNWADAVIGALTGWLWDDLGLAAAAKEFARLEAWIDRFNKQAASGDGFLVVSLRRTGLMSLDIQIPDPQLQIDDEVAPGSVGVIGAATTTNDNSAVDAATNTIGKPVDPAERRASLASTGAGGGARAAGQSGSQTVALPRKASVASNRARTASLGGQSSTGAAGGRTPSMTSTSTAGGPSSSDRRRRARGEPEDPPPSHPVPAIPGKYKEEAQAQAQARKGNGDNV